MLPNADAPVLVYRGVEDGGKVAVFELTGSVVALGDGKCEPNPEDCQILKLRAGETEFLTVTDTGAETDAQYQLELVKINTKTTTSKAELAKASTGGPQAPAQAGPQGPLRLRSQDRDAAQGATKPVPRARAAPLSKASGGSR